MPGKMDIMGDIDIKEVKASDGVLIRTVERLAREIWSEHYTPIIGKDQVEYMLDKFQSRKAISGQIENGFLYYAVRRGDDYIGYLGVLPKRDTGELCISKIYIRSEERGKGYGKKAMEFIDDVARRESLDRMTLTVNKDNAGSIKAYRRMGFRIVDSIVQDIGGGFVMDDYRMEKHVKMNKK